MNWDDTLEFYDHLIDLCPRFDRKGKSMIYTSANGYMFSMINKEVEIGIRLPKEQAEQFITKYQSTRYKSHGSFMKDYVLIPARLYQNKKLIVELLNSSYDHVMTLKPK